MAEIARDYHNDLQADRVQTPQELHEEARAEVLNSLPRCGTEADMRPLSRILTEDDVLKALLQAAPRKAAGINGYTSEFW
jgi:hypothetical protein